MNRLICFCEALLLVLCMASCNRSDGLEGGEYRQAMRDFVVRISETARACDSDFIVVPQNGVELMVSETGAEIRLAATYLAAIDGQGQEDLFYGYLTDEQLTPLSETDRMLGYLRRMKQLGKSVLVTDYCEEPEHVSYARHCCEEEGFVSFASPSRGLDCIPSGSPNGENSDDIARLGEVKNFLYLINPENFTSKTSFVDAVCATNYDLLIIDLFFNDGDSFTPEEVARMRVKSNGGHRLVICYMSIGEAEDYRYYWQPFWNRHRPQWLGKENPDWPGNYKVHYWNKEWQEIICGAGDSYLKRVLQAGFDGVYLDLVDAYEYYE